MYEDQQKCNFYLINPQREIVPPKKVFTVNHEPLAFSSKKIIDLSNKDYSEEIPGQIGIIQGQVDIKFDNIGYGDSLVERKFEDALIMIRAKYDIENFSGYEKFVSDFKSGKMTAKINKILDGIMHIHSMKIIKFISYYVKYDEANLGDEPSNILETNF